MIQPPSLMAQLQALIATPSVSSTSPSHDMGNRPVIDQLAQWLQELGFKVEIQPLPQDANKANLVATLGSGPGGLVLSGHTDTVPFNEEHWNHNPLAVTEKDQRLYGLGTTDMKGFFPIAIEAARTFIDQPFQQPLIILATADEESSMNGARTLAMQGYPKARAAVIGEPTNMRPIHLHKGIMMEAVRIKGQAGHSSNPALGLNAMEVMNQVLSEILAFRQQIQSEYQNAAFAVQTPTLNLGCIHGGDNPNRICGQCEVHFDFRSLPGMQQQEVRERLAARLQPIAAQSGAELELFSLIKGVDAFHQAADSELIRTVEKLTGHTSQAVAYATEAPFLQQLGMETVVMGPGCIDQAHQPDEYMALDQIEPAIRVLRQLIQHYCL